jgi:hypothetical protein
MELIFLSVSIEKIRTHIFQIYKIQPTPLVFTMYIVYTSDDAKQTGMRGGGVNQREG